MNHHSLTVANVCHEECGRGTMRNRASTVDFLSSHPEFSMTDFDDEQSDVESPTKRQTGCRRFRHGMRNRGTAALQFVLSLARLLATWASACILLAASFWRSKIPTASRKRRAVVMPDPEDVDTSDVTSEEERWSDSDNGSIEFRSAYSEVSDELPRPSDVSRRSTAPSRFDFCSSGDDRAPVRPCVVFDGSNRPVSPLKVQQLKNEEAVRTTSPLVASSGIEIIHGNPGDQCTFCGETLINGENVLLAPLCTDEIKHHVKCFYDSDVVFQNEEGKPIFGCDCGQFHCGVSFHSGVFSVGVAELSCTTSSDSPRQAMVAEADRSERGAALVVAYPSFAEVDPSSMAVSDGQVIVRPTRGTTGGAAVGVDPKSLAKRFKRQDVLSKEEAIYLIEQGSKVLDEEPNVLRLNGETVVVGDLHGQFFDLLNILDTCGQPPATQYLFLGDYVDRGSFSCEVALYLLSLKIAYPSKVYMIRGNHETANQTAACGFEKECCAKFGALVYDKFLEWFSALPLCAALSQEGQEKGLFCVHGGISPRLKTLSDLESIERRVEPEDGTLLADILWSDPSDDPSFVEATTRPRCQDAVDGTALKGLVCQDRPAREDAKNDQVPYDVPSTNPSEGFRRNLVRGCSWSYNLSAVNAFLDASNCRGMLRAHSVQGEGFHHHFQDACPSTLKTGEGVATVFSAPMYRSHSNRGGVLIVRDSGQIHPVGYDAVEEPPVIHSTAQAIRRACPYMPIALEEWARIEGLTWNTTEGEQSARFGDDEALALRVLWEAMSGGADMLTEASLFAFDDIYGDGSNCLHAGTVLRVLSHSDRCIPASKGEFLLLARALKERYLG